MSAQKQSSKRRADLAMIHMAGKRLFGDVSKGGDGREDYEAWLEKLTGKRSSGALNEAERAAAVRVLRREGLLPNRARGGVGRGVEGQDRPTSAQWGRIAGLARSLGWSDGLEDNRLRAFVKRTAKVENPRFITRAQASKVINGLEVWVAQKNAGASDGMS